MAKQQELIVAIRLLLDKLSDADIFISGDLLEQILVLAGETA